MESVATRMETFGQATGWAGHGFDGVHVFEPKEGKRIGQILLPEICSNLCFGGIKRNRLFMTASQSVYSLYAETQERITVKSVLFGKAQGSILFDNAVIAPRPGDPVLVFG